MNDREGGSRGRMREKLCCALVQHPNPLSLSSKVFKL